MTTRSDPLWEEVRPWLPAPGGTALCAVSGGLDSMCLLHLLTRWSRESGGTVVAAHFNHQLRGTGARRDEAFVRSYCQERGIACVCDRGDTRALAREAGLSTEEAARRLRYGFLRTEAARWKADGIYTAHHADDNAETMLLNLVRGTGVKGLTGIPRARDGIVRPLLNVSREALTAYAGAQGLPHVEDETNADPDAAARNLIRLRVMPLLKELNPRAVEAMGRTAGQLRVMDRELDEEARRRTAHAEVGEDRAALPLALLRETPGDLRARMLLELFELLGVGRKDVGAAHLGAIWRMALSGGGDARISLPHGVIARCARGWLILEKRARPLPEAVLTPEQPLRWGDWTLTLGDRRLGEGLALGPTSRGAALSVAPCRPGEWLTLPGKQGGRSVKRLCLDRHISLAERDRLPAFYVQGRLAAVWPLGVDVEFLPEGAPCRFIQIIKNTEESNYEQ